MALQRSLRSFSIVLGYHCRMQDGRSRSQHQEQTGRAFSQRYGQLTSTSSGPVGPSWTLTPFALPLTVHPPVKLLISSQTMLPEGLRVTYVSVENVAEVPAGKSGMVQVKTKLPLLLPGVL